MSKMYQLVVWLYDRLLRAYPENYRVEFEKEMRDVFSQVAREAAEIGGIQVGFIFLGELRDYPINLIKEHWMNIKGKEVVMETNISSVSGSVCPRCGFSKSVEARYCANCGRAFIPIHSYIAEKYKNFIESKTPLILFSLLALLIISGWAQHVLNASLFYPLSYIILGLGVGFFSVVFGWRMAKNPSSRGRLFLILAFMFFLGMVFLGTEAYDWNLLRTKVKPGVTLTYDFLDMETFIMRWETKEEIRGFYSSVCEPIRSCFQFYRRLEPDSDIPAILIERSWDSSDVFYQLLIGIYILGIAFIAYRSAQRISERRMAVT